MNKMQVKAMMKKPWWSYALLLAGVFIFTEGCSLLYGSDEFSIQISAILFSMVMHGTGLKDLSERLFLKKYKINSNKKRKIEQNQSLKEKSNFIANVIIQLILILIAGLCYFIELNIIKIFLFNIIAIIIYFFVSVLSYLFYKKTV